MVASAVVATTSTAEVDWFTADGFITAALVNRSAAAVSMFRV